MDPGGLACPAGTPGWQDSGCSPVKEQTHQNYSQSPETCNHTKTHSSRSDSGPASDKDKSKRNPFYNDKEWFALSSEAFQCLKFSWVTISSGPKETHFGEIRLSTCIPD